MERMIRQQAPQLTQLHRIVRHLANLLEARAAREEAQRLAMMPWMQEREQKWDARYKDDKVCGAGITHMIAKTMKGVAHGQEERERKRSDCEDGRWGAGGLPTCRHDTRKGTR